MAGASPHHPHHHTTPITPSSVSGREREQHKDEKGSASLQNRSLFIQSFQTRWWWGWGGGGGGTFLLGRSIRRLLLKRSALAVKRATILCSFLSRCDSIRGRQRRVGGVCRTGEEANMLLPIQSLRATLSENIRPSRSLFVNIYRRDLSDTPDRNICGREDEEC